MLIIVYHIPNNTSKPDTTTYLHKHLDSLMGEMYFLRKELKGKNELIKTRLNKADILKQEATIHNNETSK